MKNKKNWKKIVLALGITCVCLTTTGINMPNNIYAETNYDPLAQNIDVPSEVCSELHELITDYLSTNKDRKKKKIIKKLKKENDDYVKQWLSDYVIENYESDLNNVAEIADIYKQAYSDDDYSSIWENIGELCQDGISTENRIDDLKDRNGGDYLDVNFDILEIWEEIDCSSLVDLDIILDEYKDYLDLDDCYFYLGYNSSNEECIIMSKNRFNEREKQQMWYCTDEEKTISYMADGYEYIESVYIQLDVNDSEQNLADIKIKSLEDELQSVWYNIRYKLEGKTTSDAFEGDYIFPASSKRLLQDDDLITPEITGDDLIIGANEICARHGMIFKSSEWKTYFENKDWYEGTIDPSAFAGELSKLEQENINFLCVYYMAFGEYVATVDDYNEVWGEDYDGAYGYERLEGDDKELDNVEDTYEDAYEDLENGNDIGENTCYVINCEDSTTLWEEPDISSAELCQIPLGAAVNVLQGAPNGFVQVDYNGMTGFCLGSYLSEIQ